MAVFYALAVMSLGPSHTGRLSGIPEWLLTPLLATGIVASAALLLWFGYRAIDEWRRTTTLLATQRSSEAADLLLTALSRDMSGVQKTILGSQELTSFSADHPQEISHIIATAFARYPYPESFFAWQAGQRHDSVVFFNRSDRRPHWAPVPRELSRFPVDIAAEPLLANPILHHVSVDATRGRPLSAFELEFRGVSYQVVAQVRYADIYRERVADVIGFVVDLHWVKERYFNELTSEVWQIGPGIERGLTLSVTDASGRVVAGLPPPPTHMLTERRQFPLFFFDPDTYGTGQVAREELTVAVSAAHDPALTQAARVANQMVFVGVTASFALVGALIFMARAQRARTRLADLRADFVAAVTHELKTPIATIQAAADTLSRDRLSSMSFQACGHIVGMEAKRLSHLIENFLAYSRITDVADSYTFESLEVSVLFNDVQEAFEAQLDQRGFDLEMLIEPGTLCVRGDRMALGLLFNNLVDNAIKYSGSDPKLVLTARATHSGVCIQVIDTGLGIPADEIAGVTQKFVRGRGVSAAGTGLGLTIASRIARDHRGQFRIQSVVGRGTTVTVTLPIGQCGDRD
jgi:signal transduction histidine kinase